MKRRIAKRVTTARYYRLPRGPGDEPDAEYTFLLPHRLIRAQLYYDKYDTSQWLEHDPNLTPRMVAVLRRKPRAGRRRR